MLVALFSFCKAIIYQIVFSCTKKSESRIYCLQKHTHSWFLTLKGFLFLTGYFASFYWFSEKGRDGLPSERDKANNEFTSPSSPLNTAQLAFAVSMMNLLKEQGQVDIFLSASIFLLGVVYVLAWKMHRQFEQILKFQKIGLNYFF